MRALLVHPSLFHHPAPSVPCGLAWVAAALRSRGAQVAILDLGFVWNRSRVIPQAVRELRPDVIGLGVPHLDNDCAFHALSMLPHARWIVDRLRATSSAPIVVGGSGASLFAVEVLTHLGLRHGFVGSDPVAAAALLEAIAAGDDGATHAGAVCWDGSRYRTSTETGEAPPDQCPHAAAHDLVDYRRYLRAGGAPVVPVALERRGVLVRRGAEEIADEAAEVRAVAGTRRLILAGLTVGADVETDDVLFDAFAARAEQPSLEVEAHPAALTTQRVTRLLRGGVRALRLRLGDRLAPGHGSEPGDLATDPVAAARTALEHIAGRVPVSLELRVGAPGESPRSLARTLEALAALTPRPTRIELRPGIRLTGPAGDGVAEVRGSASGVSFLWPRFGVDVRLEHDLVARLRAGIACSPDSSVDADAYAPWQRVAHALARASGVWPAWRIEPLLTGLPKRWRRSHRQQGTFPKPADVTSAP